MTRKKRDDQPDLFDIAAARAARDEGIDRVMDSEDDWATVAQRMAVDAFRPGWVGLFEVVRRELTARGIEQPHKPQCWSALSNALLCSGAFARVDDWDQPQGVKSHGSAYRKIRRTGTARLALVPLPVAPPLDGA